MKCAVSPFRYESVIATLCENLDSLDEPEARAAMIWIVGEYAERIDNADELLESFLEGFHDESTQVGMMGLALKDLLEDIRAHVGVLEDEKALNLGCFCLVGAAAASDSNC